MDKNDKENLASRWCSNLGRYSYPVIGLDEAIALVKVLQEKCGGEATRGTFSEAIGKKGGWFSYLVGALSDYGLVDAQSGRVKITELAKKYFSESLLKKEKLQKSKLQEKSVCL